MTEPRAIRPRALLARIALAVVLAAPWLAGPNTARAQARPSTEQPSQGDITARATAHLQRGVELYGQKDYELAIAEFHAGFAIDPRPEFLFALAQAERLSGDCPTAIVYYRRFLDTEPDPNQADAARVNMKRCTRALESGPEGRRPRPARRPPRSAPIARPAPAAAVTPTVAPGLRRDRGSPWYRDPVGISLVTASVIGVGLGTGFWVAKGSAESAARDADRYDEYVAQIDRARRDRTIALVGFGAGAALAGAALIRYLVHSPGRSGDRHPTAGLTVTPGAANAIGLGIAGRF